MKLGIKKQRKNFLKDDMELSFKWMSPQKRTKKEKKTHKIQKERCRQTLEIMENGKLKREMLLVK